MKERKDNKKGVSTVVAVVLLILLTFSAVTLLLSFIKPFVEDNLKKSTECIPYNEYFQFEDNFDTNYNCYKAPTPPAANYLTGIMVKAGTKLSTEDMEQLNGFVLVFKKGADSESIKVTDGISAARVPKGIWVLETTPPYSFTVNINKPGEMITYVYNSSKQYDEVEIYPLLKSDRICEFKSDSINLIQCSGVNLQ